MQTAGKLQMESCIKLIKASPSVHGVSAHLGCSGGVSLAQGGHQLSAVTSFRPALSVDMHLGFRPMQLLHSIANI